MDDQAIIDHTRRWIESVVIGLNLCPFAGRVFKDDKIRYVVTDARDERSLLDDLAIELKALALSESAAPSEVKITILRPLWINSCGIKKSRLWATIARSGLLLL